MRKRLIFMIIVLIIVVGVIGLILLTIRELNIRTRIMSLEPQIIACEEKVRISLINRREGYSTKECVDLLKECGDKSSENKLRYKCRRLGK
jgi:cell division protein FtsL